MTRKIRPLFTKYEACTQTNLGSSAYDGQPGDADDLHHVVFPEIRNGGGKGKGGKGKKAQSAHASTGYKSAPGYAEYQLPKSKKLRKSQVNRLLDRFGRWLEKEKPVTEARKKIVPQEVAQAPGQKVGLVVDEKTLVVDVVEVVDFQPSTSGVVDLQPSTSGVVDFQPSTSGEAGFQPLNSGQVGFQSYIRGPGGFQPTTSGQWTVDSGQVSTSEQAGFQPLNSGQVDQSFTCGPGGFQPSTSTTLPVPAPVEAVSSIFGIELTASEATTVVTVSELAAALPFSKNPNLGASALPGSLDPPPNSWPSGQPDFSTLSDIDLLDPFLDWDLGSFGRDIARIEAAHPLVIPGAADDVFVTEEQSKLPWEETDSEEEQEEQRVGWGQHLGQEYWDILPFLWEDGSR